MEEPDEPGATPPPPPPPSPAGTPPPLPDEAAIATPPPLPDAEADAGPPPLPDVDPEVTDDLAEGDEAAVEEVSRRAMIHQTERTRTYPCSQCGGELEFAIREQKLKCPNCGNLQDIIEDAGRVVEEQDFRGAIAAIHSGALARTSEFLGPDAEKEIVCQNCGGHTTFRGSLTAVRCPYCATPIQRDDIQNAPSRLAVDGLLPFKVDDDTAEAAIQKWINSRWFAPNEFKKYSTTGSFTSIYAAYFTYDASTTTDYRGQRGDNYTVTVGSGENRHTEVRTRWSFRSGTVRNSFDDIPVLANTGFETKHVRGLEPWPTQQALPFSAEYIAGHLCRTYDLDVEQSFGSAKQRIESEVRDTVRRDIGGDQQRISSMSVRYDSLTFKHLLLPIWLLTVIYQQKPFQVFINGVTGEVHGQRPYSVVKITIAVVVALIIAAVIFVLYQSSGGGR